MKKLPFNTNHNVFVKLSDKGRDKYIRQFTSVPGMTIKDGEEVLAQYTNSDGWTQFQLHALMDFQGESSAHLFGTNILIEFQD